jgi:formylglycine-generating enzyme required for sulfatase activity
MSDLSGPDLNFAVAERVMEWERGRRYGNGNGEWIIPGREDKFPFTWSQTPQFSRRIDAAEKVLHKIKERGWRVFIDNHEGTGEQWRVTIAVPGCEDDPPLGVGLDASLSLAICRAALTAVDSE